MAPRPRPSTLTPVLIAATACVAAVFGALVLGGSGDSSAGAPTQTPRDPSAACEHAVQVALPCVQIESTGKLGSGIVFDGDGDIVTNAHVVPEPGRFTVATQDGTRHSATLRGAFAANDLAVIRTTDTGLKPARFADSSKLKVGERALAIGSPLGLRPSVTDGIVSATSRTVSEGNGVALTSVVQTSAAINPGNSGGALIDLTSAVIGIPTLAATDPELGGSRGRVRDLEQHRQEDRRPAGEPGSRRGTGRASLGVELRSLPTGGAIVAGVATGGPSASAGVRPGDRIAAIAGERIDSVDAVALTLAEHEPRDRVRLALQEPDGTTRLVTIKLGQLPERFALNSRAPSLRANRHG
jgi:putative serine protease PepD